MFHLRKLMQVLIFSILVLGLFVNCGAGSYMIDKYGGISIAVVNVEPNEVARYIEKGHSVNQKDGNFTPFERNIISFEIVRCKTESMENKLVILQLLLDAGAIITDNIFKLAGDIKNQEIKLRVLDILDQNLLKSNDIQKIVDIAIQNDRPFIIEYLLKSYKIKLENLPDFFKKAKDCESKKVGKLLLNFFRILGIGSDISKTGIATWNPTSIDQLLPYELIYYIAILNE